MTRPTEYEVPLRELVSTARVPLDEQVEEQDTTASREDDESAGHLPGDVRPYGA